MVTQSMVGSCKTSTASMSTVSVNKVLASVDLVQGNQAIQNLKSLARFDHQFFHQFTCKPCNKPQPNIIIQKKKEVHPPPPQGSSVCPFRSSGRMVPLAEPALSMEGLKWTQSFSLQRTECETMFQLKRKDDFRTLEMNTQPYSTIGNARHHCLVSGKQLVYMLSFTPFINGKNFSQ